MKNKKEAEEIIKILKKNYPNATCSLDFSTPFQLVIAVMLSAQCTDERVNKITPFLFKVADSPEKMSKLSLSEIEKLIRSCGFYKNKAKNILACSKMIIEKFNRNCSKQYERFNRIARNWTKKRKCYYVRSL